MIQHAGQFTYPVQADSHQLTSTAQLKLCGFRLSSFRAWVENCRNARGRFSTGGRSVQSGMVDVCCVKLAVHWLRVSAVIADFNMSGYYYAQTH